MPRIRVQYVTAVFMRWTGCASMGMSIELHFFIECAGHCVRVNIPIKREHPYPRGRRYDCKKIRGGYLVERVQGYDDERVFLNSMTFASGSNDQPGKVVLY